jgi:hypothetical protein
MAIMAFVGPRGFDARASKINKRNRLNAFVSAVYPKISEEFIT